jgi:hypothetical protein
MSDRVLVRSTMRQWDLFLYAMLGVLAGLAGVVLAVVVNAILGGILVLIGGATMIGSAFSLYRRVRNRLWVEDLGDGFLLIDPEGERRIADVHVISTALISKRNYASGLLKSTTRRFVVWLGSDTDTPERVEMTNLIELNGKDPLDPLIERINTRLGDIAKNDLARGRSVLGECWVWESKELTVRDRKATQVVPLAEVSAANIVDGKICIWRSGRDDAFARVPLDSANASVFWQLLTEHVAKLPQSDAPPPEGQLGRIIFERSPKRGSVLALVFLAGICVLVALLFTVVGLTGQTPMILVGVGALVAAVAFGVGALHTQRMAFRCHEYGVYQSGLMGERQLRYLEVACFSYAATRHFVNGSYTGTSFALSFEPVVEKSGQRIAYRTQLPNADDELDNLRDHISKVIAGRMARELNAGQPVAWTPNLRFVPEGLEYRPSGFFGRKEPFILPYREIANFELQQGMFHVWKPGATKSVVQEPVSQPNFFPGFFLLLSMRD